MNRFRFLTRVTAAVLSLLVLAVCVNTPTPDPPQPTAVVQNPPAGCHGDLYVAQVDVSRITPAPVTAYQIKQKTNWTAPYAIKATGSGEAVMQVFNATDQLLAKFLIRAAKVAGGQMTVEQWNGTKQIVFNAGNFYIQDSGGQKECKMNLLALGVGITSVGTEYLLTVRPEEREVIIVILEGAVEVTSQNRQVILDAQDEDMRLVVVREGIIQPPQRVPDPGRLLELILAGEDIPLDRLVQPPDSQPVRTVEVLQPDPVEVKPDSLTILADRRIVPVLQEAGANFEKEQGIRLVIEAADLGEIVRRFSTASQAGVGPDLVTLWHTDVYRLVDQGLLAPLESNIDPGILVPGARQAFLLDEVSYGAPYAYENLALVSNPNHIAEIPPTWSEVTRFAEISRQQERFFFPLLLPSEGYFFYPIQSAFGGYLFAYEPRSGYDRSETGLDKDGSLEAAAWLERMAAERFLTPRSMDEAWGIYTQGMGAMIITGPWSLPDLRTMGQPYQIHPFPREVQESQPLLNVLGFALSQSSPSPDYATLLVMDYLTGRGAQRAFSRNLDLPPAHLDAFDGIDADVRAFGEAGRNGVPIPPIPEMELVWGPWYQAVDSVISGSVAGPDAFYDAAEQIRAQLNR